MMQVAPQTLFGLLKTVAAVHLAALAAQPVLFGQYFTGNTEALTLHATMGETVAWLALGQALLGVFLWIKAAFPKSAMLILAAAFAVEGLQLHLGYARVSAVHIPLGTALLAASLVVTLWLWREARLQPTKR